MSGFARAFKVTLPDGRVFPGAQFPDGRCVLAETFGFDVATGFEHLELPEGSEVEWADGGQP